MGIQKIKLRGVLQKFCVAEPFFAKNQQMNLKPKTKKKLYSRGYNLLLNIITIPSDTFFV